ncbi:short-chain fatty acids transporter [Pseudomonas guineae]|uniref:Short-chain fatty acids transporter n=1 Tax=Pseudomonas guineae TaxID=425504 RepID=A0A1I3HNK5_9PSED|nr:short-chain fatty acid transporter [Pseudomonas guineae]MBU1860707.1 short-chain fatty acid transporter [Gammaproteobacteria bacterium]SFI37314.1 short-chain fatty acids transporter [Pseudomonas guineae]|tara:strand:+ start:2058 stop:3404 length:1347 start_codon:yes stop_codon:yes gene_type:complete
MFARITHWNVQLVQRYLPSPFVFSALLSLFVLALAMFSTQQGLPTMVKHWNAGFWTLLAFAMQMALVFVTGHALASAPPLRRLLDRLAAIPRSPTQAIVMITLISLLGCWINWGFGLVIGAVMARALARQVKGVDYPLLVASAYTGFLIWHGGLSGSIPLALAGGGADVARISGGVITEAIGIQMTLFTPLNLSIIALLLIGLPLLNRAMHPSPAQCKTADPALLAEPEGELPARDTPAQRLDDSRLLGLALVAMAAVYFVGHFMGKGFALDLNTVIGIFLFLGLLMHGSPERYMRAVDISVRGIGGIVLLFPFYAGIMGMMTGANADGISLAGQISQLFIEGSSADSFPLLAFLSAGVVNVFVPSGGGQWAVQGPIMLPAGQALGVAPAVTAMAIAWGDAWTNMIQPFWALPLLGIVGLGARDIMGYCLIALVYSGLVIAGCFYFLA